MEIRISTRLSSQLERERLENARTENVHGNLHGQMEKTGRSTASATRYRKFRKGMCLLQEQK